MLPFATVILALTMGLGGVPAPQAELSPVAKPPRTLSTGKEVDLSKLRTPEFPTVFIFYKPNSTLEHSFVADLRKDAGEKVGIGFIELNTGQEPVAQQYGVLETPTAMVYDRRGRLVVRSSDPTVVREAVKKAAGVMRIDWAMEGEPRYAEAQKLLGRPVLPGIMRTMTLKPEYMDMVNVLSRKAHFADGFIDRRTKEMIATYVSSINKCKY